MIWLPPYHDMGLIGGILQPMYAGGAAVLMPPAAFLQRPVRWLQAISRFRASTSGGPNFAYDLCIEKITQQEMAGLDLRSWEVAFNGAEQVREETICRFAERFGPCGFRREAMYSCFGLAESTLMVSGGKRLTTPALCTVDTAALREGRVIDQDPGRDSAQSSGTKTLVSSGGALQGGRILIVDPGRLTQSPPNQVGEIWVSGTSVAQGYWNRPEETEKIFRAHLADCGEERFLRTGDLGFLRDGNLYISGRLKDMIVVDGSNHHPQDIEYTVEKTCAFLDSGSVAAFAAEVDGRDRLIIIAEIRHRIPRGPGRKDMRFMATQVREAVSQYHDLPVHDFLLVRPGGIPRTSSGKIRHYLCRTKYVEQSLLRVEC